MARGLCTCSTPDFKSSVFVQPNYTRDGLSQKKRFPGQLASSSHCSTSERLSSGVLPLSTGSSRRWSFPTIISIDAHTFSFFMRNLHTTTMRLTRTANNCSLPVKVVNLREYGSTSICSTELLTFHKSVSTNHLYSRCTPSEITPWQTTRD